MMDTERLHLELIHVAKQIQYNVAWLEKKKKVGRKQMRSDQLGGSIHT